MAEKGVRITFPKEGGLMSDDQEKTAKTKKRNNTTEVMKDIKEGSEGH